VQVFTNGKTTFYVTKPESVHGGESLLSRILLNYIMESYEWII